MPIVVRLKSEYLRELIARGNISQNHWAIRIGISRGHWSEIVNGKHPYLSPKTRTRMLEVFGVDFDALFEQVTDTSAAEAPTFQAAIRDRYLIDEEIGQGGMGTVFLARDVKLGRRVAVKSVSTEAVAGIGFAQFLKEIRYTARLQHHNILPLYDADEVGGHPFYVMPFAADGSLRHVLDRDGQLGVGETLRLAMQIGRALDYAHSERVLHCDIKPENILLHRGHVYVADFGVARAIHAEVLEWGRQSELDSSAGTPSYVSPEQASGEPNLDVRADVYSLACMIYEMLTGEPPFTGQNSMEVVAQRFTSPVPDVRDLAPHVPRGIAAALDRAMALNPSRRTATVEHFVDDLVDGAGARLARPIASAAVVYATRGVTRRVRQSLFRFTTRLIGRWRFMEDVAQDVRHALRSIRRAPGVALVTMLTMALGIGATASIFTLVNGVMFRPLPYMAPDELVYIWDFDTRAAQLAAEMRAMDDDGKWTVSPANYVRWRERSRSFADIAAFNIWRPTLTGDAAPEELNGSVITPNFFDVMGVAPIVGAGFAPGHGEVGANDVVVLSEEFWRGRFGADSSVIGTTIHLSGAPHTVLGVIPSSYRHLEPSEVWKPIAFEEPETTFGRYLRVIGRLRPGVTLESAEGDLRALAADMAIETPEGNLGWDLYLIDIRSELFGDARGSMFLLLGAAALVFLIACTNVANIVLARSQSRRKEYALRTALGAGRHRLARLLIVENVAIALGGGILGLVGVQAILGYIRSVQGQFLSSVADIQVDATVTMFVIVSAIGAGIVLGLLPLLQMSHTNLRAPLSEDSSGTGTSQAAGRLRSGLVVSQVSLAAVLVVGAGLLMRSFVALINVSPGFDPQQVLTSGISLPRGSYSTPEQQLLFFDQMLERIRSIPGVEDVALTGDVPFSNQNWFRNVNPLDDLRPEGEELLLEYRRITPGFFRVLGIPFLSGRDFGPQDRAETDGVVIVNEEFADRVWPGADALTKQMYIDEHTLATVIGIVANALDDGLDSEPEPRFYQPLSQLPASSSAMVMRVRGDMRSIPSAVQREVAALDGGVLVREFQEMESIVAETMAESRLALSLAGLFSLLAVAMAAVGIYGVMSYTVGERRREIGVRAALGAQRSDVMGIILRRSLALAVGGTVLGVGVAMIMSRALAAMLFEVQPGDPLTLIATPMLLAGVAILASYVPALRATRISPIEALRSD